MTGLSLLVIDGNNWFRRKAETDMMGNPLRRCYYEIQSSPHDVIILVWDGYNALKARRAIYPEYKMTRRSPGESLYAVQKTFKGLAKLSRAIVIEIENFEADDVIAAVVNHYKKDRAIGNIVIDSNDADLSQLGCEMTRKEFHVPPAWIPLYKTVVGDPSDNIKGCPGFGKGAWEKLTEADRQHLLSCIEEGTGIEDMPVLSKRCQTWLQDATNMKELQKYFQIVNFIDMDWQLIQSKMITGTDNMKEAEIALKEFMC